MASKKNNSHDDISYFSKPQNLRLLQVIFIFVKYFFPLGSSPPTVKLLCGADWLEALAEPNIWADEDVSSRNLQYLIKD